MKSAATNGETRTSLRRTTATNSSATETSIRTIDGKIQPFLQSVNPSFANFDTCRNSGEIIGQRSFCFHRQEGTNISD